MPGLTRGCMRLRFVHAGLIEWGAGTSRAWSRVSRTFTSLSLIDASENLLCARVVVCVLVERVAGVRSGGEGGGKGGRRGQRARVSWKKTSSPS